MCNQKSRTFLQVKPEDYLQPPPSFGYRVLRIGPVQETQTQLGRSRPVERVLNAPLRHETGGEAPLHLPRHVRPPSLCPKNPERGWEVALDCRPDALRSHKLTLYPLAPQWRAWQLPSRGGTPLLAVRRSYLD